jgi:streptogramin lyase
MPIVTAFCQKMAILILALTLAMVAIGKASAATLYATSIGGSQIDKVNTVANTETTFINTPSAADSIIFDASGNMLYTELYTGQIRRYNPTSLVDSAVTLPYSLSNPADMALDPGGATMLVSEYAAGRIDRVNLTTGAITPLLTPGGDPEGLAYVGNKLFANIGYRYGGVTGKEVVQIDPVTGAILAVSPGLDSLDGLTYDPYSGLLYASSLFGNKIYSIDPNNLNNVQDVTAKLGVVPGPDGITSDGVGDIFVASSDSLGDSHVYQLNLISDTLTMETYVPGLDDLAPAAGPGSFPTPDNGSSLGLLCVGLAGIALCRGKFHKASAIKS